VSESVSDHFGVDAASQHPCRGGVPQVVEANVRQTGLGEDAAECPINGGSAQLKSPKGPGKLVRDRPTPCPLRGDALAGDGGAHVGPRQAWGGSATRRVRLVLAM